jgi:hypothetical protein
MAPPAGSSRPDYETMERLISGLAASDERFREIFRRLDKAEKTAGEARDSSREILTVLREQDALAKVAEAKAELRGLVADLRQDVVKANTSLRGEAVRITERVEALEVVRTETRGMARGARLIAEAAKLVAASGVGAFLAKHFGH